MCSMLGTVGPLLHQSAIWSYYVYCKHTPLRSSYMTDILLPPVPSRVSTSQAIPYSWVRLLTCCLTMQQFDIVANRTDQDNSMIFPRSLFQTVNCKSCLKLPKATAFKNNLEFCQAMLAEQATTFQDIFCNNI